MSFIQKQTGHTSAPGYFLASEDCRRETRQVGNSIATALANGTKYVKAGTPYPSNTTSAIGFVYEDTDVTTGTMPASIVTFGSVYETALPVTISASVKSALEGKGFKFQNEPSVTRPY